MAEVSTLLQSSPYGTLPRPQVARRDSAASRRSKNTFGLTAPSPVPLGAASSTGSRSRIGSPVSDPFALLSGEGRTTDNIIEAIFNPVPTSSTASSPFTYYVPPRQRPPPLVLPAMAENGSIGTKSDFSEGPRSAVSTQTSHSSSYSDHHHLPRLHIALEEGTRSIHSQSDSLSPSTSTSASASSSAPHSTHSSPKQPLQSQQPQSNARRWWQKFTGSRVLAGRTDNGEGSGFAAVAEENERQSQDDIPQSYSPYEASIASRGSGSIEVNPGVQIFVRSPTSPPVS